MTNDNSLATILLVSRLLRGDVKPFSAREYWTLCDQLGELSVVFDQRLDDLTGVHGLDLERARRIVGLVKRATAMAFKLEALDQSGISTLTPFDEHYPSRFRDQLVDKAPAILYAAGNLTLLRDRGVGIVGSRNVTPEGADIAKGAALAAVRDDCVVVSGGARGVDQLAMNATYQAGGKVVGVLADSLIRKLKKPDVRQAIYEERAVFCTPYNPNSGFNIGKAMGRNKLIYALSELIFVVTCETDKGGTWSGATEALKDESGRVGVWLGEGKGSGNEHLVERGAIPIRTMDDLKITLRNPESFPIKSVRNTQGFLL